MQPVDLTALTAVSADLRAQWLPARCEQVYQRDRFTLFIALRTLESRGWLLVSWHPQAARLHMSAPPPKLPDTFTFSQQLKHQLGGLALTRIVPLAPWERALDLQFARRPEEPALWHLYVEIMGKYSNVILTDAVGQIVTAAHQVSEQQSSVRPIQTGQSYQPPPAIRGKLPALAEDIDSWRDRLTLIPGDLKRLIVKSYSGVSSAIASQLMGAAGLAVGVTTEALSEADWQQLFLNWQAWLRCLDEEAFSPCWLGKAAHLQADYSVIGQLLVPSKTQPVDDVQQLLEVYYRDQFNQVEFRRLHHQLMQKVKARLTKLRQKEKMFLQRLSQSGQADAYRLKADLLMANLHQWQVGMDQIELVAFETGEPVVLPLNPEKNAVQNAQLLYKQHQKLKRAKIAVQPLLRDVQAEMGYLEQVEEGLLQVAVYQEPADLRSLEEMRDELVMQGYLNVSQPYLRGRLAKKSSSRYKPRAVTEPYRYTTPEGIDILVGRNNSQNERLTFKQATDYDLWFHAQEIPGSHVLLRLDAGAVPSDESLQLAANLAAYYSRGRQSEQVPVVYTEPKSVYKPKGALPGMVIYKHERVIWGKPLQAQAFIHQ